MNFAPAVNVETSLWKCNGGAADCRLKSSSGVDHPETISLTKDDFQKQLFTGKSTLMQLTVRCFQLKNTFETWEWGEFLFWLQKKTKTEEKLEKIIIFCLSRSKPTNGQWPTLGTYNTKTNENFEFLLEKWTLKLKLNKILSSLWL